MDTRRYLIALGLLVGATLIVDDLAARGSAHDAVATLQAPAPAQGGRAGRSLPKGEREHIIEGTAADDVIDASDGDDWLFGRDGHDVLRGAAGRDTLDGGPGDDSLFGGTGHDVLDGGTGRDVVFGGDDNDFIDGGDGDDLIDGGAGIDDIDGGDGDDIVFGGPGDDALAGGDGNDVISGGDGADRLFGRDGDDRLSGGGGDDVVEGGDGRDTLNGDDGSDRLDGGDADDVMRGGGGDDVLKGASGNDVVHGEAGNDTLTGSRGDDTLDGGDGFDTLIGGDGRDTLAGGVGDDVLIGGNGADVINGLSDDDMIILRSGDVPAGGLEMLDGGAGTDTLVLNGFPSTENTGSQDLDRALVDRSTGGTYRLVSIENVRHAHVFTDFRSTENAPAALMFVNPSAAPVSARILFFNSDGAALLQQTDGGAARSAHSFTVPALGRVRLAVSGAAQKARGGAVVLADRPLSGFVETPPADSGAPNAREARLVDSLIIPVSRSKANETDTGVSIFASTVPSNVKLTLHRTNGEEVSTANQGASEIDVPANGHRVVFVGDVFPFAGDDFEGTLTVEGGIDRPQDGGPLAASGLQRDKTGTASFPVIPISPVAETATLQFATMPVGGDHRTSITLVNPSPTSPARGALTFFDPNGKSRAIALSGHAASPSFAYDIAPLGSAVFTAVAGGPLRPGTARAVSKDGIVGAVVQVASATAGTLRTGPSDVGPAFAAPVSRNRTIGLDTTVALSSTRSALTLTLTLTDGRGTEVPGGRTQVQLAADGGLSQTLDALFPKADLGDFQGTLTARADAGTFAIDITQSGGPAGAVARLPVIPLR